MMMKLQCLSLVLFIIMLHLCSASSTDKQLLRNTHTKSSHKVALPNGNGYTSSQSSTKFKNIKKESTSTNNYNIVSPFGAERGMSLIKSMATIVRDEILDCVDSLVYAESNEEVIFICSLI